jgi:hypothetical protein
MIPYVEIRDRYTLKAVALIEPQECWFELSYQDVGECEVYCRASAENLAAVKKGRFVTIPNKRFIWYITSVRYIYTAGGARMISAKGYEAKQLLKKRCILTPKELSGTITRAVYGLVDDALGRGASGERKINNFTVDTNELLIDISGTQAARGNLIEFVNPLLASYGCGSIVEFIDGVLKYRIFAGDVKTDTVRFSQSLDNLNASDYYSDDSNKATSVLVVSTIDEKDYTQVYETAETGIDRAEVVLESNLSTTYEDANGTEQETTPDSELYKGWQREEGRNKLAEHITVDEITGDIDIANSHYFFDDDFFIGDLVRTQDEYFNFFVDVRITKYTFKQDASGYGELAEYGG